MVQNKGYVDDIWYTHIKNDIYYNYEWKLFPIKVPFKRIAVCIVALKNIIILIDYEHSSKNIWCMDMMNINIDLFE